VRIQGTGAGHVWEGMGGTLAPKWIFKGRKRDSVTAVVPRGGQECSLPAVSASWNPIHTSRESQNSITIV
jgi:hypothetical protein